MKRKKHNHLIIMIAAHIAPLLLFLILPKFGISSQWIMALFVLTMVIAHVWMMKGHSRHKGDPK